jgi:hypothetical protein
MQLITKRGAAAEVNLSAKFVAAIPAKGDAGVPFDYFIMINCFDNF